MIHYYTPDMCKKLRIDNGISLDDLSKRVGLTKQAMSYFERNYNKMSENVVKKNRILYTVALLDYIQEKRNKKSQKNTTL